MKEWQRLKYTHPQRFEEVANWEQAQREKEGRISQFTILKETVKGEMRPLPLHKLGERKGEQLRLGVVSNEDVIGCFCEY